MSERLLRALHSVPQLLFAAGLLGLGHALFLLQRYDFMANAEMARGLLGLALGVALLTMLALFPAVLILRRRHPAWKGEGENADRAAASAAAALAVSVAAASWIPLVRVLGAPLLPSALAPWLAAALALGAGWLVFRLIAPGRRLVSAGAGFTVALLAITLFPAAGSRGSGSVVAERDHRPAGDRPDVVLVTLDTLRADRFGVYGRQPSLTPSMDRVGRAGTVFHRTLASSPWTVPSVASILTGLPTIRHGAGLPFGASAALRTPLAAEFPTLAERFQKAGYRTAAVVANGFLSPAMGMARGFERYENPLLKSVQAGILLEMPLTRIIMSLVPPEKIGDTRAAGITDRALEWLAEDMDEDPRPLFLWVHYIDPHIPYQADPDKLELFSLADKLNDQPEVMEDGTIIGEDFLAVQKIRGGELWLSEGDRQRLVEYYDREVAYLDEHVGRLFDALEERSRERPLIAALTADHGEEFWDHGRFEHGHDYYREVTWVPLFFWGPEIVPAGREIAEPTGLVDVAPTLLELAGLEVPRPTSVDEGRSLVATWTDEGETLSAPRFSEGNLYNLPAVLVEDGRWRFILRANGRGELYDVLDDPAESRDLAFAEPEIAARYRELLRPRLDVFLERVSGASGEEMSAEAIESLKALGYLQ